ncbi:helix-turn-helix domain-containing protein [Streptomyces avermitilis]|uniref:helix-turn-helix domain-containing protein n=1 Tax=Streptomyces avermitilis TaxID=33903 RepID=UPI003BB6D050
MLRLSRARKAPRDLALRAWMVELSWARQRVPAVADELRRSLKTVRRWLHHFNRLGLQVAAPPSRRGPLSAPRCLARPEDSYRLVRRRLRVVESPLDGDLQPCHPQPRSSPVTPPLRPTTRPQYKLGRSRPRR